MAKIVYRQMPAPRAKARMQTPQGGGKFLVQFPGGVRGMVLDEIDTCISLTCISIRCDPNSKLSVGRRSAGRVHTPPFSINPGWHYFHRGGLSYPL